MLNATATSVILWTLWVGPGPGSATPWLADKPAGNRPEMDSAILHGSLVLAKGQSEWLDPSCPECGDAIDILAPPIEDDSSSLGRKERGDHGHGHWIDFVDFGEGPAVCREYGHKKCCEYPDGRIVCK